MAIATTVTIMIQTELNNTVRTHCYNHLFNISI